MAMNQAPYTGDEDLDAWTSEITRQINDGELAGAATVEITMDDEDRPVVGGVTLGYALDFLHTRYATSADGTENFTNDYSSLTGTTIYQGLRNSASSAESDNPADYIWRQLSVVEGWAPYYQLIGGRQIEWMFVTAAPPNYTLDGGGTVINLTDFVAGAPGPAAIQVQVTIRTTNDITTDPSTWALEDEGQFFRNNAGDTKYLLATVFIGGIEQDQTAHNSYNYSWQRNGTAFTPSTGNSLARFVTITADNVDDGGADQFSCVVTNINI